MDILAARKKAAEKARAAKTEASPRTEPETVPAPEPSKRAEPDSQAAAVQAEPAPAAGPEVLPPEAAPAPPEDVDEEAPENAVEEIEILAFRLSGEEYAVMVSDVREVLKARDLTAVPNAPDHIMGVTSLRGTMLPVIDLCRRLGLAQGERDEKSRIVVVSPDEEDVGLMVDRVTGVVRIPPDAVKPAPENVAHGADYLQGIVRKGEKLYILLDLVKSVGT